MSLQCAEHGHDFSTKDTIYVAKRGNKMVAFCAPLFRAIPLDERSKSQGFGMVGIYTATAQASHGMPEVVSRLSLRSDKWQFSLPAETLERYLPKVHRELNR